MLKALRHWVLEEEESASPEASASAADRREIDALSPEEKQLSNLYDMCGYRGVIRSRRTMAFIHLKDLSCFSACGITDLPVAVGAMVFLTLKKGRWHAAEVRWVRNVMIGMRFYRPLDPELVEKVHSAHVASKASAERDEWALHGITPADYPR